MQGCLEECSKERDEIRTKLELVSNQNSLLAGHTNRRQRIHHVSILKEEIKTLTEENKRLRERIIGTLWKQP